MKKTIILIALCCLLNASDIHAVQLGTHIIPRDYPKLTERIRIMKQLNITLFRVPLLWDKVEPKKGLYDWAMYDRIVDIANDNDLKVVFTIRAISKWGSREYPDMSKRGYNFSSLPLHMDDYESFIIELSKHYKGRVEYFQIENEPNAPVFWKGSIADYIKLLTVAYSAVKSVDHNIKVISAGLACGVTKPIRHDEIIEQIKQYTQAIVESKAFDIFDIHNYYPIENTNTPSRINFSDYLDIFYDIFERDGHYVPVWLTEFGILSDTYDFPKGIKPFISSEKRQANDFSKVYNTVKLRCIDAIFWLKLYDFQEGFFTNMGLLNKKGKEKKAFDIIRNLGKE